MDYGQFRIMKYDRVFKSYDLNSTKKKKNLSYSSNSLKYFYWEVIKSVKVI